MDLLAQVVGSNRCGEFLDSVIVPMGWMDYAHDGFTGNVTTDLNTQYHNIASKRKRILFLDYSSPAVLGSPEIVSL